MHKAAVLTSLAVGAAAILVALVAGRDTRAPQPLMSPASSLAGTTRGVPAREATALDGPLSAPANGAPRAIASAWLARNPKALGWRFARFRKTLRSDAQRRDRLGRTHLRWTQRVDGVPVIDGDVRVSVGRRGEIQQFSSTLRPVLRWPSSERRSVAQLRRRLAADGSLSDVQLVGVSHPRPRLAYAAVQRRADGDTRVLVDASTLRVLRETRIERDLSAAWFPRHPTESDGSDRDIGEVPSDWLRAGGDEQIIDGARVRVWPDLDADGEVDLPQERVPRDEHGDLIAPRTGEAIVPPRGGCHPDGLCAFDPARRPTWTQNAPSSAASAFMRANAFLGFLRDVYGWSADKGAPTEREPLMLSVATGTGGDLTNENGKPRVKIGEAYVYPPGTRPLVKLGLHVQEAGRGWSRAYLSDGAEIADVVAHEITHVFFGRIHRGPDEWPDNHARQSTALDEALADVVALDWQIHTGVRSDDLDAVDVVFGNAVGDGGIRAQPVDCPVLRSLPSAEDVESCVVGATYGDFGLPSWSPHRSGEIVAQTLWELRSELIRARSGAGEGIDRWRELLSAALDGLPIEPTYLDVRNALLLGASDTGAAELTDDQRLIWRVFAARGMGYEAFVPDADSLTVVPSQANPPAAGANVGIINGAVVEGVGGEEASVTAPIAGATVRLRNRADADGRPVLTTTDELGRFRIEFDMARGRGGSDSRLVELLVTKPGYAPYATERSVRDRIEDTVKVALRRDYAAPANGAQFEGADGWRGCVSKMLFDDALGVPRLGGYRVAGRRAMFAIELPQPVDLTTMMIDARDTCDAAPDGSISRSRGWAAVSATVTLIDGDRGRHEVFTGQRLAPGPNPLRLPSGSGRGVRRVEITIEGRTPPEGLKPYVGLNEVRLFGPAAPAPTADLHLPDAANAGDTVRVDAAGSQCPARLDGLETPEALHGCSAAAFDLRPEPGFETPSDDLDEELEVTGPGPRRACVDVVDVFGQHDQQCAELYADGGQIIEVPTESAAR